MKKRLILTAFLLFAAVAANAQLRWDVRLGANVSQFSEGNAGLKLGVKAGVTAEYGFSKLFALRPGVYFSMKGSSDTTDFASDFPTSTNISYIEVPVLVSFRLPITQGFGLAFNAGPYMAFRVNDSVAGAERFDVGAEAGVDFVFGRFVFGPSAQYGLTKVFTAGSDDMHNVCYSLTFGYKF